MKYILNDKKMSDIRVSRRVLWMFKDILKRVIDEKKRIRKMQTSILSVNLNFFCDEF